MTKARLLGAVLALTYATACQAASAQGEGAVQSDEIAELRAELRSARQLLDQQQRELNARAAQIQQIERRLAGLSGSNAPVQTASNDNAADEPVGQSPEGRTPPVEIATVDNGAGIITRAGQVTVDWFLDYAQANRSRALFRGIGAADSLLIGVFDINESRQQIISSGLGLRIGLTDRLEISGQLPFVMRRDHSVLEPIRTGGGDNVAALDQSISASGIGDGALTLRYQLNGAHGSEAVFVASGQLIMPTGRGPFQIARANDGTPSGAATGAGFWGAGMGVNVLIPSDPAAIFLGVSYMRNFGRSVDTTLPPVRVVHVEPGDSLSFNIGMALVVNERSSFNLGYAHSWVMPATLRQIQMDDLTGTIKERRYADAQLGRLQFGISYRLNPSTTVNWSIELGATHDAADVRTSLRIPFVLRQGH